MVTVSLVQAKTHLSGLLDQVEAGQEVFISLSADDRRFALRVAQDKSRLRAFLLDYEIDKKIWRKKSEPWHCRRPDEVRDEMLACLLALNAKRTAKKRRALAPWKAGWRGVR